MGQTTLENKTTYFIGQPTVGYETPTVENART